jgi:hypothetical protein
MLNACLVAKFRSFQDSFHVVVESPSCATGPLPISWTVTGGGVVREGHPHKLIARKGSFSWQKACWRVEKGPGDFAENGRGEGGSAGEEEGRIPRKHEVAGRGISACCWTTSGSAEGPGT